MNILNAASIFYHFGPFRNQQATLLFILFKLFTKESEKVLSKAIEKRNYVVHNLFRDDLRKNYLETNPKFYFKELEETISLLNTINESLVEIFNQQKEEYKVIW